MDLILFFCFINFLFLIFLYVRFFRFSKTILTREDALLVQMKKQLERLDRTAVKQEDMLEQGLAQSRKHLLTTFNDQLETDVKLIGKHLDERIQEYTTSIFSRTDDVLSKAVSKSEAEIIEAKKNTMADMEKRVQELIVRAAKISIARGLSLSVHEEMVKRAIEEVRHELSE